MKLLVTGASGYVAKFVIEELSKEHDLVLFGRRDLSQSSYGTLTGADLLRGDLTNLEDCRKAVQNVDGVVHLGGINEPSAETFRVNTLGTYYLLEASREAEMRRFVLASSNCVLGHCFRFTGRPFEAKYFPIDEAHPSSIEDNYGLSKFINEETLHLYARAYGMAGIALRLAWCWGPTEVKGRKTQPFTAADHREGFWGYVDMRDVAQAFRLSLDATRGMQGTFAAYNISAADTIADEPSVELVKRFYPQHIHLADPLVGHASFFSYKSATQDLGYRPRYSWREN